LKKGRQRKIGHNPKSKKTKETCKRKIHFEESDSDFPTDIDKNEFYDDDVSDDGDDFTDRNVCLI
jgi:hypothetical protein